MLSFHVDCRYQFVYTLIDDNNKTTLNVVFSSFNLENFWRIFVLFVSVLRYIGHSISKINSRIELE